MIEMPQGFKNTMPQILAQIEKTSNCWIWKGSTNGDGYGQTCWKGKTLGAYRLMYELSKGKMPRDKCLDHLCRNRLCVNPDHLEPVTNKENILRGFGICGVNARKTHCKRGHEFDFYNTLVHKDGRRQCKECIILSNMKNLKRYHSDRGYRLKLSIDAKLRYQRRKKEAIIDGSV